MDLVKNVMERVKLVLEQEVPQTPCDIEWLEADVTVNKHMKKYTLKIVFPESQATLLISRLNVDCFSPYNFTLNGSLDDAAKKWIQHLWKTIDSVERSHHVPYTIFSFHEFYQQDTVNVWKEYGVLEVCEEKNTLMNTAPVLARWYGDLTKTWYGILRDEEATLQCGLFEEDVIALFEEASALDPTIEISYSEVPVDTRPCLSYYVPGFYGTLYRRYDGHHVYYESVFHPIRSDARYTRHDIHRLIDMHAKEQAVRNVLHPPTYHYDKLMRFSLISDWADPLYQALRDVMSPRDIERFASSKEGWDIHRFHSEWEAPFNYGIGFGHYLVFEQPMIVLLFTERQEWKDHIHHILSRIQEKTFASIEQSIGHPVTKR